MPRNTEFPQPFNDLHSCASMRPRRDAAEYLVDRGFQSLTVRSFNEAAA